jgi:hypothetical protein
MSAVNREQVLQQAVRWAERSGFEATSIPDTSHDFVIEVSEKASLPSVQIIHQKPGHAFLLFVGYVSIPKEDRMVLKEWGPAQFLEMIWNIKIDLQRMGVDFTVLGEDDKDPEGWEVQRRLFLEGSGPNQYHEAYSAIKHSLIGIIWCYKRAMDLMRVQTSNGRAFSVGGAGPARTGYGSGSESNAPRDAERSRRILNAMMNTSIILMVTLMEGFGQMVVEAAGAMASGMAEAAGGEEAGEEVAEELEGKGTEVAEHLNAMISEVRSDIYAQIESKREEIEPLLADRAFDAGPELIEVYDFGLPKLTEELDDDTIAHYARLLVKEDRYFTELFGELTKWINTLPALPK